MKWFDRWMYGKVRDMWDNRHKYESLNYIEEPKGSLKMASGQMAVERGRAEGEDRITFELSAAVGGRILNVRRYQDRLDRHESQTYVIPSGEDVGARVAKIINLELIK
jgi:hypothetical protein